MPGPEGGRTEGTPQGSVRDRFGESLGFSLDRFQVEALDALDTDKSVLVAAPTGAGKTVVANYAVHRAIAAGRRAVYTTPLKALSNQKFRDFAALYGAGNVGLLTGDNALNGAAPVVVMTTEVLRNMLHADASSLGDLGVVVLDEVHFIDDPYRGQVWEEVIIFTPPGVQLACLSATISNVGELADWIRTVRGPTEAVVSAERPVRLFQRYLVGDRTSKRAHLLPMFVHGHPNPDCLATDRRGGPRPSGAAGGRRPGAASARARSRFFAPDPVAIVEELGNDDLLPAIDFLFSRAACDAAAAACLQMGPRLTTAADRSAIRHVAEAKVEMLSDDELRALGYGPWLSALEAGYAPHHAGLVPPFREAVEECFLRNYVKVVFATETLSLGINMPARTVVIERPWKLGGEDRRLLTPGEYAQMTGRAGRRGIDHVGYAVVVWSRHVAFKEVAAMAHAQPSPLGSSFRPTYNLTANLIRRFSPDEAHQVLNLSFAQFLVDAEIVRHEANHAPGRVLAGEPQPTRRARRGEIAVPRGHHRNVPQTALAAEFDRSIEVLDRLGYVAGWALTPAGDRLASVYHDLDLVVAELIVSGALDGLRPSELAGVASVLTFEARRSRGQARRPDRVPERIAVALDEVFDVAARIRSAEEAVGAPVSRALDAGLVVAAAAWARGRDLEVVLDLAALAPGDFVRQIKQLVDLLRQIATLAAPGNLGKAARAACRALDRDVVAASSAVVPAGGGLAVPAVPAARRVPARPDARP